jgi:hypothetical protein
LEPKSPDEKKLRFMKISMRKKMSLFGLAVFLLALLDSCTRLPPSSFPDASNPIVKVAVLPIQNFTSDINGPFWIRAGIRDMVLSKHYTVIPNDLVDQILSEQMCVTLGGQLDYRNPAIGAPSPSVVGQTLDVDGFIYCNLEDFQNIATVVYNRRRVKVRCSLVNIKTADIVWEKEEEESHVKMNVIAENLASALIKALSNPLDVETAAVINKMKSTIPSGPVVDAKE